MGRLGDDGVGERVVLGVGARGCRITGGVDGRAEGPVEQTGAWLTWVTVTLTVAVLESRLPSLAL